MKKLLILSVYFILNGFLLIGTVKADDIAVSNAVNISVDGIYENTQVVVKDRQPLFSWEEVFIYGSGEYSDQQEFDIQVGTVLGGNDIWDFHDENMDSGPDAHVYYAGTTALQPDTTYYWQVRVWNGDIPFASSSTWVSSKFVTTTMNTSFKSEEAELVIDWNNPIYPESTDPEKRYCKIRYRLFDKGREVKIRVFTLGGEYIRTLDTQIALEKAVYTTVWDGKTDRGGLAAEGIYLINMDAGDPKVNKTKRVVVIR